MNYNSLLDFALQAVKNKPYNPAMGDSNIDIIMHIKKKMKQATKGYIPNNADRDMLEKVFKRLERDGYMCEITLHKITVLYWYHGQCGYDYFSYQASDTTIDILWSYRSDCILNMDFLEKSNGIKNFPKRGDDFATLTLINDTTLKVKYRFPEWAKKVNEITKDSLFSAYYYLRQEN